MRDGWLARRLEECSGMDRYMGPVTPQGALKLDSNENLAVPEDISRDLIKDAAHSIDARLYPDGGAPGLVEAISHYIDVPKEMIGVGSGSDQILDLILSCIASTDTRVLAADPTFGFFEARCGMYGIPMVRVPFSDEMTLDSDELEAQSSKAEILYLDSPNNPTGFQIPQDRLRSLIGGFEGLVIIDEAYGEFADYSAVQWVREFDNLIVTRTFSKAFGMAGLRIGYFAASRKIADTFNDFIQYPYPVSSLAAMACTKILQKMNQYNAYISEIKDERRRLTDELRKYDAFEVFDSQANFVLFDAGGAQAHVHTALAEQRISIRRLGKVGGRTGCLRVTVGTRDMNSRFLLAIRDLLG